MGATRTILYQNILNARKKITPVFSVSESLSRPLRGVPQRVVSENAYATH